MAAANSRRRGLREIVGMLVSFVDAGNSRPTSDDC
jgi:hypothetical protein